MKTFNDERHLGALLMTIDHRMRRAFRTAFAEQELRRGDWRMLHTLEQAPASPEELRARRAERKSQRAERLAARGFKRGVEQLAEDGTPGTESGAEHGKRRGRGLRHRRHGFGGHGHGKRGHRERPSLEGRLASLQERGLIELDGEQYRLTTAGQDAHAQLKTKVAQLRERTANGISEEEWNTTLTTLKRIAENLAPAS